MEQVIYIHQGLGELRFKMPVEDTVAAIGQANEVEEIDNAADEPTTVLHYYDLGLTLFFEGENPTLACIDTSNTETQIFGIKIFNTNERGIVNAMVQNNYTEQDADEEDWGERRISFPQANIDFYLDKGKLTSVIFGE